MFQEKNLNKIIERYSKDHNIEGVMLFGSLVRGKIDKYSDIDIYVLTNKLSKYSRQSFYIAKYPVDILIDSIDEVSGYLKNERFSIWKNVSHMIAHGKIIFDRNGLLQKFKKIAGDNLRNKTKYTKDEILLHKYSISDFWGEIQRFIEEKNYFAFGRNAEFLINNIIGVFLKIHGIFLLRPNELIESINKIDSAFANKLIKYYKTKTLLEKLSILKWLVQYTHKNYGGKLPKKWNVLNK